VSIALFIPEPDIAFMNVALFVNTDVFTLVNLIEPALMVQFKNIFFTLLMSVIELISKFNLRVLR
jgi:hypothetical protein